MTFNLTCLLEEIAVAEDMTEVAAIVEHHENQIKDLPPRQRERASERIAGAISEKLE